MGEKKPTPKRKPASGRKPAAAARAKAKPRPKPAPAASTAPPRVRTPAEIVTRIDEPAEARPPRSGPSNGLAIAAIACAVAGLSFVPMIGGVIGAGIGATAIDRERRFPDRYTGAHLARIAVYIGLLTAIIPLGILALIASDDITPIPFVAVVGYATWVIATGLRGTSVKHKVAVVSGGIGLTVIAVILAVVLALLFYFGIRALSIEIGSAIGDAFSQMFEGIFDGLSDAFGSCR